MYDSEMVKPMREELTSAGVRELKTASEVESFMQEKARTKLVFVNSVCGCAAGSARPGLIHSLQSEKRPDQVSTVFAGVDTEAVEAARKHMVGYSPSSPSAALFREDRLVRMMERHDIEGIPAGVFGDFLKSIYDKYCGETVDESIKIKTAKDSLKISCQEVQEMIKSKIPFTFLDCRDEYEREKASIQGTQILTQDLAEEIVEKGDRTTPLVLHCHHGGRSMQATLFFQQHGFRQAKSMEGGIEAWASEIDISIPKY